MTYAQIIVKNGDKIKAIRTLQTKTRLKADINTYKKRYPTLDMVVLFENFINPSDHLKSYNPANRHELRKKKLEKISYMGWWGEQKGSEAAQLAKEFLGLDNHLHLTKEQVQTIYKLNFGE